MYHVYGKIGARLYTRSSRELRGCVEDGVQKQAGDEVWRRIWRSVSVPINHSVSVHILASLPEMRSAKI